MTWEQRRDAALARADEERRADDCVCDVPGLEQAPCDDYEPRARGTACRRCGHDRECHDAADC